jgi:uncharacterized protein YdhG (YjbR/CyaY superfamily)
MKITSAKTISGYVAKTPEPARTTLKKILAVIRSNVPSQTVETISYGIPMFKLNGMLVGCAAFTEHCSLFPCNAGLIKKFAAELKPYATAKGTIRFPKDKPLPTALIKKLVKTRVTENKNELNVKRKKSR